MSREYSLPPLAYDYGALAPVIDGRIMELHHDKHHAAYVAGANTALEALEAARASADYGRITMLEKNLAFHVSGHVLHSLFWTNLTPGGRAPDAALTAALTDDFGSIDAFRAHMTQTAMTAQGSAWAVAAWEPVSARVIVQQVHDHQDNLVLGATPILAIDAWEHAYYLQYQNEKGRFFDAIWDIVDWGDVGTRLAAARG
jgi:Fe-Mn family superoxide dismutase